MLGIQKKKEIN